MIDLYDLTERLLTFIKIYIFIGIEQPLSLW